MMISQKELDIWCESQRECQLTLLKALAAIPAPSHQEQARAEYIRNWLIARGVKNVTIDDALNVIVPYCCTSDSKLLLCMAHTDVVFPDTTPLPIREESGRLYAPGVGDDTANVVSLMLCIHFLLTHPGVYERPTLFVFNSCEEGLGNLKGVRQIMKDYCGRIEEMVSFDLQSDSIITKAVGSERWEINVSTSGGHSFADFGNANAIHRLAELICTLYRQDIPCKENSKTTFNVGTISGGTSVNTIAQNASVTYEYRSDAPDCMKQMARQLQKILSEANHTAVHISAISIGNRPCSMEIDQEKHQHLINRCSKAIQSVYSLTPIYHSGSTDANIPLSLGIPAVTFGLYRGGGAHTRQEFVEIDSLVPGLKIALTFLLQESIEDLTLTSHSDHDTNTAFN